MIRRPLRHVTQTASPLSIPYTMVLKHASPSEPLLFYLFLKPFLVFLNANLPNMICLGYSLSFAASPHLLRRSYGLYVKHL